MESGGRASAKDYSDRFGIPEFVGQSFTRIRLEPPTEISADSQSTLIGCVATLGAGKFKMKVTGVIIFQSKSRGAQR